MFWGFFGKVGYMLKILFAAPPNYISPTCVPLSCIPLVSMFLCGVSPVVSCFAFFVLVFLLRVHVLCSCAA